jgi:hypothetical protein
MESQLGKDDSQIVVVIVTIRPIGLLWSAAITLCIHGDRKLNLYVQKEKKKFLCSHEKVH